MCSSLRVNESIPRSQRNFFPGARVGPRRSVDELVQDFQRFSMLLQDLDPCVSDPGLSHGALNLLAQWTRQAGHKTVAEVGVAEIAHTVRTNGHLGHLLDRVPILV